MKIAEIMTSNPELCTVNDSIVDCAKLMAARDIGVVPICASRDTRQLVGCVTDRDIVVRVIAEGRELDTPIEQVMTSRLVTCRPDADVEDARQLMEEHQIRRLMIVDEHQSLVGIVATADLARAVEEREVGETLEAISQPAPTLNTK